MNKPGLNILQRLTLREEQIFFALTIIIAIIAGLTAVLFALAIQGVQYSFFGLMPSAWRLVLIPTFVSLLTGYLLLRFFPDARGSGVPQTKAAYHLNQGIIPPLVPFGKFLTGVLCVGSGHSMGREGPSVQIGAGIASSIGHWFGLAPERVRNLVPVGAAAALSAAFNTPVAAVLFALEEIIGDLNAPLIGSTVVASVTAVVVERSILGNEALFRVPAYELAHPAELMAYACLGIVGGLVSLLFCKGLLRTRAFFLRLPRATLMFQPAVGGLCIGVILIFVPQVMGVGYEHIDRALGGGMAIQMMLLLCATKLVATTISYASGNAGGIFAPSLYLGAMSGGVIGVLLQQYAPFPTGDPGAYALVGMGTLFAGIIRAPMTSVFMILELTQDYQIIVPLMVANTLSLTISRKYQPKPVYHALLEQNHVYLPGPESRLAGAWRVKDIMIQDLEFLPAETSINEVRDRSNTKILDFVLLGAREDFRGVVAINTIEEAAKAGRGAQPIGSLAVREFERLHPDQSLEYALERFAPTPGVMPVISRSGARRVEGVITIESILRFVQKKPA